MHTFIYSQVYRYLFLKKGNILLGCQFDIRLTKITGLFSRKYLLGIIPRTQNIEIMLNLTHLNITFGVVFRLIQELPGEKNWRPT